MMQFKAGWMIATALTTLNLLATDASAQRFERRGPVWVQLGCQSVGFTVDRDVINVGRHEGRFKAIRLTATGSRVHMFNLRVIYSNGEPDALPVNSELLPGVPTRPIDLRGYERSISRIELVYRANPSFRGRAHVCVDGLA